MSGEAANAPGNGRLDAVDFAAAVELVAEQIQQQHIVRAQAGQHVGEPQLVAFENAPLGSGCCRSAEVMPAARFAPVRLQMIVHPAASKASASRLFVEVFPLVPTVMTEPLRALAAQLVEQRRINGERDLPRQISRRPPRHMTQPPG